MSISTITLDPQAYKSYLARIQQEMTDIEDLSLDLNKQGYSSMLPGNIKCRSMLPYYDSVASEFKTRIRNHHNYLRDHWNTMALAQQKLDHEKDLEAMRLEFQQTIRFQEIEAEVCKAKIESEALKKKIEAEVLKTKAETDILKIKAAAEAKALQAKTEDEKIKKEKDIVNGTLKEEADDAADRLNQAYQLVVTDLFGSLPSGVPQNQDIRSVLVDFLRMSLQRNNEENNKPPLSKTRQENDGCAAPPAVATSTNHFWVQLPSSS